MLCRNDTNRSGGVFDLDEKQQQVTELEKRSLEPDFWSDNVSAQKQMRELAELREQVDTWNSFGQALADTRELLDLAAGEEDEAVAADMAAEVDRLQAELETRVLQLALAGKHDRDDAILAIHAGEGGTEAQDWASILLRMYLRWAERHGYRATITDQTEGEGAGVKSVYVEIEGTNAYGYLKSERGNHRLVRLSPFDAANRRHTSFAKVEVMPLLDDDIEIQINPNDLRLDFFLSGGAGGQNVQKNSTAVRLTHIPSGIVVTCQNERSQLQNRESAMRVLRGKLYDIERQKLDAEKATLKGEHVVAGFGSRIRSYVLHPYQMVKDERTGYETGNTQAMLDGEIDGFIEAWLRLQAGDTQERIGS